MSRPPFGEEPDVTLCDICGDRVVIPPGVIYRGEKLHKGCAKLRRKDDFGEEVLSDFYDQTEQGILDLFGNMESMTDEDKTTDEKIEDAKAEG